MNESPVPGRGGRFFSLLFFLLPLGYLLLSFLLLVKIGGSLRGVCWGRYGIEARRDVRQVQEGRGPEAIG